VRESRNNGEGGQVSTINQEGEVCKMQKAETILAIIQERGKRGLPLERIYRELFNPELYLLAYGKIYRNQGAMTPGVTTETVDGMSLEKIRTIIEALRQERYQWTPVRRTYIEKKNSTKKRPLGIPTWSDKLLQEVIRLILEAYYEPQFSDQSHGFRPQRGCHTALQEIKRTWNGTVWFIEGDISQCFDTLDQPFLVSILKEKIHDNRFLRLIENLLKAGYLENWKYNATYSGTPQGGIVSPILSNIYLDKLDKFYEETLRPAYNRGRKRKENPEYHYLRKKAVRRRAQGKVEEARLLREATRKLPSRLLDDPDYRRLRYIRYADDFLLGFIGPRSEALEIKQRIGDFLRDHLKLELSEEKTLITHARSEAARFLGYEIETMNDDQKRDERGRRTINGVIGLKIPLEVIKEHCRPLMQDGKPIHRKELTNNQLFTIVDQYQSEYRGLVQYYQLAYNLHRFRTLKQVMEVSLTKTLAHKLKVSVKKVYDRFQATHQTDQGPYKVLEVAVEREEGKKPLVTRWGGIPLKWRKDAILNDQPPQIWYKDTEVVERLLANICELCGSKEDVEVHHIRALKDLKQGQRAEMPKWAKTMAKRHRKSLIVGRQCHVGEKGIHPGRYDGPQLGQ